MDYSLLVIKPDAIERGLIGIVISAIENAGLQIKAMELRQHDITFWKHHYREHRSQSNFDKLCLTMSNKPVVAIKVAYTSQDQPCWFQARKIVKFLRKNYAESPRRNVIHGSDSEEAAARELQLWGFNINEKEQKEVRIVWSLFTDAEELQSGNVVFDNTEEAEEYANRIIVKYINQELKCCPNGKRLDHYLKEWRRSSNISYVSPNHCFTIKKI